MSLRHTRHALGLLALLMLTAGRPSLAAGQRYVPGGAILSADGRDVLDLDRGTEVTMIATAPRYRTSRR